MRAEGMHDDGGDYLLKSNLLDKAEVCSIRSHQLDSCEDVEVGVPDVDGYATKGIGFESKFSGLSHLLVLVSYQDVISLTSGQFSPIVKMGGLEEPVEIHSWLMEEIH